MKKAIVSLCSIIIIFTIIRCGHSGLHNHGANGLDSLKAEHPIGTTFWDTQFNKFQTSISGVVLNSSNAFNYKDFEVEVDYFGHSAKPVLTKTITITGNIAEPGTRCFIVERINDQYTQGLSRDTVYKLTWKLLKATPVLRSTNQ